MRLWRGGPIIGLAWALPLLPLLACAVCDHETPAADQNPARPAAPNDLNDYLDAVELQATISADVMWQFTSLHLKAEWDQSLASEPCWRDSLRANLESIRSLAARYNELSPAAKGARRANALFHQAAKHMHRLAEEYLLWLDGGERRHIDNAVAALNAMNERLDKAADEVEVISRNRFRGATTPCTCPAAQLVA